MQPSNLSPSVRHSFQLLCPTSLRWGKSPAAGALRTSVESQIAGHHDHASAHRHKKVNSAPVAMDHADDQIGGTWGSLIISFQALLEPAVNLAKTSGLSTDIENRPYQNPELTKEGYFLFRFDYRARRMGLSLLAIFPNSKFGKVSNPSLIFFYF